MELEFFKLLGHIQMKLTESNVKASFDNMKGHLAEHDVTAEFVDIDYNYFTNPKELMGPVITYRSSKRDMNFFIEQHLEDNFPGVIKVIPVS